ncbi:hypothetical protein ACTXMZ_18370, partial [Brachybacterium alimentarium]|uniref:hypothetical protein n=1 Tax=Brachybacterium alimentarium TaxID=47845 RepID=UPI003FD0F945
MTTYTARSFEKAQLAHHPDGRVAARINDHEYPWAGLNVGGARENFGDGEMARKGWVPVQENPRPLTADD